MTDQTQYLYLADAAKIQSVGDGKYNIQYYADSPVEAKNAAMAVVVTLIDGEPFFFVTKRGKFMKSPGELVFPGGGFSEADGSAEQAAEREFGEETGFDINNLYSIGRLPAMANANGTVIHPTLFLLDEPSEEIIGGCMRINAVAQQNEASGEVAHAFLLPAKEFFEPEIWEVADNIELFESGDKDRQIPIHKFLRSTIPVPLLNAVGSQVEETGQHVKGLIAEMIMQVVSSFKSSDELKDYIRFIKECEKTHIPVIFAYTANGKELRPEAIQLLEKASSCPEMLSEAELDDLYYINKVKFILEKRNILNKANNHYQKLERLNQNKEYRDEEAPEPELVLDHIPLGHPLREPLERLQEEVVNSRLRFNGTSMFEQINWTKQHLIRICGKNKVDAKELRKLEVDFAPELIKIQDQSSVRIPQSVLQTSLGSKVIEILADTRENREEVLKAVIGGGLMSNWLATIDMARNAFVMAPEALHYPSHKKEKRTLSTSILRERDDFSRVGSKVSQEDVAMGIEFGGSDSPYAIYRNDWARLAGVQVKFQRQVCESILSSALSFEELLRPEILAKAVRQTDAYKEVRGMIQEKSPRFDGITMEMENWLDLVVAGLNMARGGQRIGMAR